MLKLKVGTVNGARRHGPTPWIHVFHAGEEFAVRVQVSDDGFNSIHLIFDAPLSFNIVRDEVQDAAD